LTPIAGETTLPAMHARHAPDSYRALPWWALAACAPALLIVIAVLSPEGGLVDQLARSVFAPFCHQDPTRSLLLQGHLLPVCARCTGFYMGLALAGTLLFGALIAGRRTPAARAWLWLLLPLAIDGLANLTGAWQTPDGVRLAVGAAAALPFALLIMDSRRVAH